MNFPNVLDQDDLEVSQKADLPSKGVLEQHAEHTKIVQELLLSGNSDELTRYLKSLQVEKPTDKQESVVDHPSI